MSLARTMHINDRKPDFNPVLLDEDGLPYDLSTAVSVKVTCEKADGTSVFSLRSATGNSSGQVTMAWSAGDLNAATEYRLIVVVEWAASQVQTFPAEEGYFVVNVIDRP